MRNGTVLASLVVPATRRERRKGLLGRDGFEGALLIEPARSVHTIGMRFPVDVALLDADRRVIKVMTLPRFRVSMPVRGCRSILEAEAGAFHIWNLQVGDELEIKHTADGPQ